MNVIGYRSPLVRYWGRKPIDLANYYIKKFSSPGDVVLDSFGGSGVFIRTALQLQRRAIYIDLNPFAELIAHASIEGCNADHFEQAARQILSRDVIPIKIMKTVYNVPRSKLFAIKCLCGKEIEAKYLIFTRVYHINRKTKLDLTGLRERIWSFVLHKGKITHNELLSHYIKENTTAISRAIKWLVKNNFVSEQEVPEAALYKTPCKCGRISRILMEDPWVIKGPIQPIYWYPKNKLYYRRKISFFKKRDSDSVNDFFLDRSLALLSAIWKDIRTLRVGKDVKRCLQLAFMTTLARSSKMCRPSGGTWPVNSYWIPRRYLIRNPYIVFESAVTQIKNILKRQTRVKCGKVDKVIEGKADVSFSIADSTNLNLKPASIDYVIVDPPHTDEAQFFELSLFYTAWLRKKLDFKNELIINPKQGKDLNSYLLMLRNASKRIYRALKPGRYYTIVLHEEDKNILDACMRSICSIGFLMLKKDIIGNYTIYTFKKPKIASRQ